LAPPALASGVDRLRPICVKATEKLFADAQKQAIDGAEIAEDKAASMNRSWRYRSLP
jgi:hypothetical protein